MLLTTACVVLTGVQCIMGDALADYIASARAKSFSDSAIRDKLYSAGWNKGDVETAFSRAGSAVPSAAAPAAAISAVSSSVSDNFDASSFLKSNRGAYSSNNKRPLLPKLSLPRLSVPRLAMPRLGPLKLPAISMPALPRLPLGKSPAQSSRSTAASGLPLQGLVNSIFKPFDALKASRYSADLFGALKNFSLPFAVFFAIFFLVRLAVPGGLGERPVAEIAEAFISIGLITTFVWANLGLINVLATHWLLRAWGVRSNLLPQTYAFSIAYRSMAAFILITFLALSISPAAGLLLAVASAIYALYLLSTACQQSTGAPILKSIAVTALSTIVLYGVAYLGARFIVGA